MPQIIPIRNLKNTAEIYEQLAVAEAQQKCGENIDGFAHLDALKNKYDL